MFKVSWFLSLQNIRQCQAGQFAMILLFSLGQSSWWINAKLLSSWCCGHDSFLKQSCMMAPRKCSWLQHDVGTKLCNGMLLLLARVLGAPQFVLMKLATYFHHQLHLFCWNLQDIYSTSTWDPLFIPKGQQPSLLSPPCMQSFIELGRENYCFIIQ